jgi:hypothetical protein
MPAVLAAWKPKELEPNGKHHPALPSPGNRYFEIETAREWGIPLNVWDAVPEEKRAEMIAHENHRNLRNAYAMEEIKPAAPGVINKARARMGLGPVK